MHRSRIVAAATLLAGTALLGVPAGRAVAVVTGPPTHYVVHELMAAGDSGDAYVSGNGRYLFIDDSGFGGEVYDLSAGELISEIHGNGAVQLTLAQGVDDSGVVAGTYQNTATDPITVTGFRWYPKDAMHPDGHDAEDLVPSDLIETYYPDCSKFKTDEALFFHAIGPDGTVYGAASCGSSTTALAIMQPTNGSIELAGGTTSYGAPPNITTLPTAVEADGVGENGDIIGMGNSGNGTRPLTWNPSGNPKAVPIERSGNVILGGIDTGMLFRNLDDFIGDGFLHWNKHDYTIPKNFKPVGLLNYGTLVGNSVNAFPVGTAEVVQPKIDGTTTLTTLAKISTLPAHSELGSILGVDEAGDIYGEMTVSGTEHYFRAVPEPIHPAPTISLKSPVGNHAYKKGSTLKASFTCKAGSGTTLVSCKGTVATGKKISTAKVGSHAFTVTATDKDGRVTKKTVHYTVKKK